MFSEKSIPKMMDDEKVIMVVRRSLVALFRRLLAFLISLVLPLPFFYLVALDVFPGIMENQLMFPAIILSASAYYLFVWLLFFFNFIDYYLDIWVITTERVIDINQKGFFARIVSEQMIYRVQDATSEVKGVIPTLFNYGNLNVQTAGEVQRFIFYEIHNPSKIRDLILKLSNESQKRREEHGR